MAVKCFLSALLSALLLVGLAVPAAAGPWAETGDRLLRSDLEVLHNFGLFAGPVTTWPIPWAQISAGLGAAAPEGLPPHVRRSLQRVQARLADETETYRFQGELQSAMASEPSLVRDFGRRARRELDVLGGVEFLWPTTAIRLNLGYQNDFDELDEDVALEDEIVFDGSYVAQELGNWLIYGGELEQWWGPGQISALLLSNSARPFPRVGIMRNNPTAFRHPWLSWIGPIQFNAFLGLLEEDRADFSFPLLAGARLSISPLPGLDLGFERTLMGCGEDRPCDLELWGRALIGDDNTSSIDTQLGAQLIGLDARYTGRIRQQPFSLYGEIIAEDTFRDNSAGLAGLSLWNGIGDQGAQWRLTVEYSDTLGFGIPEFEEDEGDERRPNVIYESGTYTTGHRYRGRPIGHSLDNDAMLLTVQAALTDVRDWTYRLTYHHAELNRDGTEFLPGTQTVSRSAEYLNIVEAELSIPWQQSLFDVALRVQDDQPDTPGEREWQFAAEARWRLRF